MTFPVIFNICCLTNEKAPKMCLAVMSKVTQVGVAIFAYSDRKLGSGSRHNDRSTEKMVQEVSKETKRAIICEENITEVMQGLKSNENNEIFQNNEMFHAACKFAYSFA